MIKKKVMGHFPSFFNQRGNHTEQFLFGGLNIYQPLYGSLIDDG